MEKSRFYILVIHHFFLLLLILLMSGFWMFVEHTHLTFSGVMNYYSPKTVFGLLETLTPHLFGMGVVLFILTHFYTIIKGLTSRKMYKVLLLLFIVMMFSNLSTLFIVDKAMFFAGVKLLSTLLLIVLSLVLIVDLAKKIG